jgi:microcystin-dependent protein
MPTPLIGLIQLYAFGYAPLGYLLCNGAVLTIDETTRALFTLIGSTFGGNGVTTFGLPDMTGARPENVDSKFMCYYIARDGYYPSRN